jgi:hypothetical protein
MADQVTFSWKNYARPTPANLLRIAEFLKGLFVLVTSLAAFEAVHSKNPWWVIASACIGYTLDQATKFFATADKEAKKTITIEMDADAPATVTEEIKPPDETLNNK